jgi:type IV pilus assembly protein PilM
MAGVDVSTSGVKIACLSEGPHGLELASHAQVMFPTGSFTDGEITDHGAVAKAIAEAAAQVGISSANATLPESKEYLFEASAPGRTKNEWRTAVEQHLDELVPLPPMETAFDIMGVGTSETGDTQVAGIGFARRIVDSTIAAFDDAGVELRSLEGETFALARALLPPGDDSTTLIVDVGKTTTKFAIVQKRVPRFATTIEIGGHSLTLAVQKHFGVTETEARRVKADRGIVPAPGNEDYLAAMLSTVSAIRDEIARHLEYWQARAAHSGMHEPVSQAILAGGNASLRGLPEYLEGSLHIPVHMGDVFRNLASRDYWLPSLDYNESLAFATAIGLALRDVDGPYA